MIVVEGWGETGVSRYPPAEGERYSQRGPAMSAGEGRGETGVSRYPPAEGERNVPSGEPGPPAGAEPTGMNDAASPPGSTTTNGVQAGADAPEGKIGAAWYSASAHAQATVASQAHNVLPSPYIGRNSLLPREPPATSMTGTLFLAARLRESERNDGQTIFRKWPEVFPQRLSPEAEKTAENQAIPPVNVRSLLATYFSPEIAGGTGLSRTSGSVGLPDGEITSAGIAEPAPYLARLFPCQTFGHGDERGTVGEGQGDTGVSRYPPAEGERTPERGPAMNIGERQADIGVSRYPPAEGERNVPSGVRQPPAGVAWYSAHEQATVVTQVHNVFPSPYIGKNSLLPREPPATSMTGTLFFAARLWGSERNDGQLIFNPEIAGGTGFSRTSGIAGFPNFEITRVGVAKPTPYLARLYLRQTFGFGGEREQAADDINQVAGERDVHRLDVIVGKLAAPDVADDNRYAKDPRTEFLNWALAVNGAWDYPANVRGYTYGVALDYNHSKNWSLDYAVFAEPAFANGGPLDWHLLKAQGQVAELEERYELSGRPGATRLMTFLNHAHMGNYNEALAEMPVDPDVTKTRSYRYKYGFCVSIDQTLTDDLGFLSRLGWNDGHTESWAFTAIDRTASAGLVLGGRRWCRPYDRVGLAGILNGLSGPHRAYLAAGGLDFIIGDGRLRYGPEEILEIYYALQVRAGIAVTFDFQEVGNPAYNRDRGPVSIGSIRVHFEH
ncbi:MAG: carbohydrate porin [Planctomycetaceae bacterium]|nr:carbohydrate porin [Planctomycetaceae bacterium]